MDCTGIVTSIPMARAGFVTLLRIDFHDVALPYNDRLIISNDKNEIKRHGDILIFCA